MIPKDENIAKRKRKEARKRKEREIEKLWVNSAAMQIDN